MYGTQELYSALLAAKQASQEIGAPNQRAQNNHSPKTDEQDTISELCVRIKLA